MLHDDYSRHLFGGKRFIWDTTSNVPDARDSSDVDTSRVNSRGYRSNEFTSNTDLVVAGCSMTYGSGLPDSARWGDMLATLLKVDNHANISAPGLSILDIIDQLFIYFNNYGNPKNLAALFPGLQRLLIPVDGNTTKASDKNNIGIWGTRSADCSSFFETLFIQDAIREGQTRSVIKKPFPVESIFSLDLATYLNIRAIRHLEQYCKSSGINFIWGTWDYPFIQTLKHCQANELYAFQYYSQSVSEATSTKKSRDSTRFDMFSTWDSQDKCATAHPDDCTDCILSKCHLDVLDLYPRHFFLGDDTANGLQYAHPGAHFQAHCAEAFYNEFRDK